MKNYKLVFFSTVLLILLFFAKQYLNYSSPDTERIFRAALDSIPEKIDPRKNDVHSYHYINLQAYYPLFEDSKDGELKSRFLDVKRTQSLNLSMKDFVFCLKDGIKFSDRSPIRISDLKSSLEETHDFRGDLQKISHSKIENGCLQVSLENPDIKYFDYLTTVSTTVLKKETSDKPIPVGLGDYRIDKLNKDSVVLLPVNKPGSSQPTKIIFQKVSSVEDARKLGIDDPNHAYGIKKSQLPKDRYFEINRPMAKSVFILAKIKDSILRKKLASCFPRRQYREMINSFFSVHELDGYLPNGVIGADVSFDQVKEKTDCKFTSDVILRAGVFEPERAEKSNALISEFQKQLPNIKFEVFTDETALGFLQGEDEGLFLISADAEDGREFNFFKPFTAKENLVFDQLHSISEILKDSRNEIDSEKIRHAFKKAHRELLTSGFIIPIGQIVGTHIFSKRVEKVRIEDMSRGIPRVAKLRLRDKKL